MTTEPELLSAVLAAPDDDAPRLAFADFLDARGDGRAKHIRQQIEVIRLRDAEGVTTRVIRLFNDTEALGAQHGAAWEPRITALTESFTLRRGFVEEITLSAAAFLDHAAELFALGPIRHVNLTRAGEVAARLFQSPHLARLESLRLDRAGLGDAEARQLAASPYLGALRWLSLMQNQMGEDGLDALAGSPHFPALGYVVFTGNIVDPSEQYAADQGVILQAWLPEAGLAMEAKHGPIRWLHCDARTTDDVPPPRY